jgi:hypothetical protein
MVNLDWGPMGANWLELAQIEPVVINWTKD